jgi:hypothetical protein
VTRRERICVGYTSYAHALFDPAQQAYLVRTRWVFLTMGAVHANGNHVRLRRRRNSTALVGSTRREWTAASESPSAPTQAVGEAARRHWRARLAALGVVAAVGATRLLSSLLYGVSPVGPVNFAGTATLVVGIALAASYILAWRAVRIDPMDALRAH